MLESFAKNRIRNDILLSNNQTINDVLNDEQAVIPLTVEFNENSIRLILEFLIETDNTSHNIQETISIDDDNWSEPNDIEPNNLKYIHNNLSGKGTENNPYIITNDTVEKSNFYYEKKINSAAGLFISMSDLTKYINTIIYNPTKIINKKYHNKMIKKHKLKHSKINNNKIYYGYGIQIEDFINDTLINHSGHMTVNTVWMGTLKNNKLTVCIGCNLDQKNNKNNRKSYYVYYIKK